MLDGLGTPSYSAAGDLSIAGVTDAQLDDALAALSRGDIEYVILEDDDHFLQAAGEGDGPYQVQRSDGGETMHEIVGGITGTAMRQLLHDYLRGDARWMAAAWTAMD